MNITEKELIRLCKKKNAMAQQLLYDTYHSSLLGICLRYGKSKAEAEDILQMSMIRIFQNIGTYSGKGSFEGWMKQIVVNIAIDNFRKNKKFYYHEDIDEINSTPFNTMEIPDHFEVKDILNTIQQLPTGYRMVFNLYAIEGYTHKEISERLRISENTSKTQLLKARKSLKNKLLILNKLPSQETIENDRRTKEYR